VRRHWPPTTAGGGLAEVVVTAQKRAQSLQDVSVAVTAVDSARLRDNIVLSLEDVQFIAPSVSFGNSLGYAKVFIRGIGLDEQTPGIDPSVAVHVDGAVINQPIGHFASLFDLERVEILRGPQGTLYGRNATGGSINLITAKPTATAQGYARATTGNFGLLVGEGALGGPLTEHIKARVAVRANIRDGYGCNESDGHGCRRRPRQGGPCASAIRLHRSNESLVGRRVLPPERSRARSQIQSGDVSELHHRPAPHAARPRRLPDAHARLRRPSTIRPTISRRLPPPAR
jgi:outer membrane receptor protein involved in Fe transport